MNEVIQQKIRDLDYDKERDLEIAEDAIKVEDAGSYSSGSDEFHSDRPMQKVQLMEPGRELHDIKSETEIESNIVED